MKESFKQNLLVASFLSNYVSIYDTMKREYTHKATYWGIPCYYNTSTQCLTGANPFYSLILGASIILRYYLRPLFGCKTALVTEELSQDNRLH